MSHKQLWTKQSDFILAFNWNKFREITLGWNCGAKVILLFYLILSPNL